MSSNNTNLTYFHLLFEAKDISMTTRTLGSDEMCVQSDYSWTPLDYCVTDHAISHSKCPWKLNFRYSSIDDEKFELDVLPLGQLNAWAMSHISYSRNDITSKGMQSSANIPSHILQGMTELQQQTKWKCMWPVGQGSTINVHVRTAFTSWKPNRLQWCCWSDQGTQWQWSETTVAVPIFVRSVVIESTDDAGYTLWGQVVVTNVKLLKWVTWFQ